MAFETIIYEKKDFMGIISLNRPDYFNTFSSQMATELCRALTQAEEDKDVKIVIVKGEGKVFSTGIDISEYPEKSPWEYQEWMALMDKMHFIVASMGKPVIAMVHKYAVANGAGLMFAADFAIVSEGTKIGTTAINVGLICTSPIIPVMYGVGKKKSLEMLLCGEMIDAKEALELGLVNKVVPQEKLEEETFEFAKNLASKSPVALRIGKEFYYKALDMTFRQKFDYSTELFARLCTTEDAKEGVTAFIEKRKPQWKGR